MEKKLTSHIIKGIILALVLVVIGFAGRAAGIDKESWFGFVSYAVLVAGIIISCIMYSNELEHNVTFGNVFAHGFKTTAVTTSITILVTVIIMLAMPQLKEEIMETARLQAEKGGATEDQIQTQQDFLKRMFWVFVIGGILVMYLIVGCIASLIGAAVAKKNPNHNPF